MEHLISSFKLTAPAPHFYSRSKHSTCIKVCVLERFNADLQRKSVMSSYFQGSWTYNQWRGDTYIKWLKTKPPKLKRQIMWLEQNCNNNNNYWFTVEGYQWLPKYKKPLKLELASRLKPKHFDAKSKWHQLTIGVSIQAFREQGEALDSGVVRECLWEREGEGNGSEQRAQAVGGSKWGKGKQLTFSRTLCR